MRSLRKLSAVLLLGLLALAGAAHAGSGYKVNGTDLDSIFAPYHAGWPQAAATGIKVNGVDLNQRYAPLSTGSAASATQYRVNGVDLNAIFAAYGTTGVLVATQPSAVSGSAAAGNPSGTVTSNTTSTAGTKGGGSYTYAWHLASGSASFTNPSGASTAVTATVNAGTTSSGTMYCSISDGVTSVNTNTVSWSLQNTTLPTFSFSITAANHQPQLGSAWNGYESGIAGSITNSAMASGATLYAIYNTGTSPINSVVKISGFTSDPGASFFTSVTANGVTLDSSNATYTPPSSSNGWVATWSWAYGGSNGYFGFTAGNNYPATINY